MGFIFVVIHPLDFRLCCMLERIVFLATLACLIKGIDEYADLLRLSIATPGNDHRLGGNEAPPATISMFLGNDINKVDKLLKEGGYETKMVLQIHDELIFKVPNHEKDIVYPLIKKTMEEALQLDVELYVDGGFGKDWYSAK